MKTVAVVICHHYRDIDKVDTRIDLYEVPDNYDKELFKSDLQSRLSGHFYILRITETISAPKKWVAPIQL